MSQKGDLLKHIIGICHIFDHGYTCIAQRHDHGAGENQAEGYGMDGSAG